MVHEPDIAVEDVPAAEGAALPTAGASLPLVEEARDPGPASESVPASAPPARRGLPLGAVARKIVLPGLAALLVSGFTWLALPPRYAAEARLMPEARNIASPATRAQILSSREFARQVIDTAGLADRLIPERPSLSDRLNAVLGAPAAASTGETAALRVLEGGLSVRDRTDGQTAIRFVAADPALAADVANAVADSYLRLREARGAFNMEAGGPIALPVRLAARATPAAAPLAPAPALAAAGAGFATLAAALGLSYWRRRRQRPAPLRPQPETPLLPQTAPEGAAHLPWIGGESPDDTEDTLLPRRRLSRDGEVADLARLIDMRGEAARLVAVTGPAPDEGIARCALALARALATPERRTVIVCLDVTAPALAELTADPRAPGLTDLLFGVASFSDVIHREAASRCHVIPPGRGACEASGLMAADRLTLILTALMQTYDHVVVAAPPLCHTEGAERVAALKPTLILVTEPGGPATDAVQAFDALAAQGFADIAMVTFTAAETAPLPQAA